jgi:hypothetical protein
MQLQKLQEDRANMAALSQKLSVKGVTPRQYFEALQTSGDPQYQQLGIEGLMKLDETEKYDAILKSRQTIPGQTPARTAGALGSGTAFMDNALTGVPAPVNALRPPAAPMAATNALAPQAAAPMAADPVAAIDAEIALYENLKDSRAKDKVARLQKQRDELTKLYSVGGNLVSGTGKSLFTAPAAPTDVKKLLMERDALPPGSPNRALYDQQIKDLGATAQAARDRLAFDQQKFKWEKDNPGHTLIQDESGNYFAANTRTNTVTPLMVAGSAVAPAAPAGGGQGARGSVGVTDGGRPMVPFVGKSAGMTESQGAATNYGMRMQEAHQLLSDLEKSGETNTGLIKGVVGGTVGLVPYLGDKLESATGSVFNALPRILGGLSPEQQQVANARINFITAVLRKESGASISPGEFTTAEKLYFPQPGDDEKAIAQKQKARELSIKGMKVQAGPGAKNIGASGGAVSSANDPLGLR